MIRVTSRPEPPDFDRHVRIPGRAALAEGRDPLPPYWRSCLKDLWTAYDGICAYLATYIPSGTGARSVEHFAPKSKAKDLAYEWSNYRLACSSMNSRKNHFEDVLDPFEIEDDWFELQITFMTVHARTDLPEEVRERVERTIVRLDLNDNECIAVRLEWQEMYEEGLSFALFRRRAPFVAREIERQGLRREGD